MVKAPRKARKRIRKPRPVYVIVPKHQMRAKEPSFLVDPHKVTVVELTTDIAKAATFKDRSGAFRRVNENKALRGKYWYRRVTA